jgi:hypothetical protein
VGGGRDEREAERVWLGLVGWGGEAGLGWWFGVGVWVGGAEKANFGGGMGRIVRGWAAADDRGSRGRGCLGGEGMGGGRGGLGGGD